MTPLTQLKIEFYEWCGLLSIDEVMSNSSLMEAIEQVERTLLGLGA